jgi:hypothetical protein
MAILAKYAYRERNSEEEVSDPDWFIKNAVYSFAHGEPIL